MWGSAKQRCKRGGWLGLICLGGPPGPANPPPFAFMPPTALSRPLCPAGMEQPPRRCSPRLSRGGVCV